MVLKQWISWRPKKINDNCYTHPATYKDWFPEGVNIVETNYMSGKFTDPIEKWVYFGILEYPDSYTATGVQNTFAKEAMFKFKLVKATDVVKKCNTLYPSGDKDILYFSLEEDGFTLIDDRPVEDDLI